ncbi:MAG: carboxypeptidase regulatory-like domain-containing protein [Deltaproteobacteria bacterium]|nr:carboxypeptidase regulatory-like domain-containing protein [Deltaproteobacteria bacterium]
MRTLRHTLGMIALGLAVLGAERAEAQDRTGRIEGTIYDDQGLPLAGARVTASSPTQIGGARSTTAGADGAFRFIGLIPGVFKISVSKAGFQGATKEGVRVEVGQTATLDILLDKAAEPEPPPRPLKPGQKAPPPKPKAETYVITSARPVVDVTKSTTGETLSDEYIENLPILGRGYQGVAGMTRNVTQERNPKGSGAGNPSVSGGSYFNNTYTVDGMETTDPVTHTFSTNFNFDAMADVNIMTGGMGAEFSDTPGGVINMVTKSGSNKFELDSSIYWQDDALTIKGPDELGSTFRTLDFNLNVGGPIVKDKLWYYTSFELNESSGTIPPDPNRILPNHPARRYLGVKWLGKLTWQVNPKHKLVWWAQTSPASISNTQNAITWEPDAESHQNQYNVLTTGAWEWLATDKLFVKTQLGFGWNGLRVSPQSGVTDVAGIEDIGTGVHQRNYTGVTKDDRYRVSLNADATYFGGGKRVGEHEIKGGIRYQYLVNPSEESVPGNTIYKYQFGQPYSQTRYFLDFDDATACDPNARGYDPAKCAQGTLSTSVSGNKLILFLQDRWSPPRYKRLKVIPGAAVHFGDAINPDGQAVVRFFTPTAHVNFAWDPWGNGKTVFRGGYNQYVDVGFLALARFIGRDLISYECSHDPDTNTYSRNCTLGGQTRTVGRPDGPDFDAQGKAQNKFNPTGLTSPRVHELAFGAEREWFTGFSTGLDFTYRLYRNQWEDLETNVLWNEVGDQAVGFKNGKSEFIFDLETPKEAYRRYVSASLFARRFVGNWQLMASYTWSRSEGTVVEGYATEYLDRARQAQFYNGFLPDDRRHVLRLTGWYRFKFGLTAGGTLWVGSGTPYDRLYFNNYFKDYQDRRAVRGYDPKDLSTPDDDAELRTPTRAVLNLKVSYKLTHLLKRFIGEAHSLELIGEVFNAINFRPPTRFEERNLSPGASTQWGQILSREDPFKVRFGLRYRY